ncbi:hypothetical protein IHE45_05G003300 [Dioscorea alata]|uniref:Uncharacterized protein n=1 Tax=Dioscorea alata TaxID=55571 RepID=A0ACB7VZH5_DIOAL|nr:hypothetical protein IHE45_05G003300 [Dioscorea alata]
MGACDPSCSESHPCGVLGCPSSPFIDPPAVIEPETGSLRPSGTTGALEETSPLITASNESHPLEQPPSAPVLPDKAISPTPQPPPPPPPPPPMMAAPMPYQEQAIPPRQFVGESSAPAAPAAAPQGLDNHEVPIQRVESVDYPPPGHRPFGGEDLGRRGTRRPFPGPHSRWPSYRRVENFWYGRDSDNCVPPRSRRVRDRVPSYCPNMDDYNYVPVPVPVPVPPPPFRRWNTFPTREPPSSSSARQNHEDPQAGPSDGRQPAAGDQGTLVRDNIVIGDPTRVRIGEGNRGGRSTGGRVTGNVVIR